MWHSYKLEQPQPLADYDCIFPKVVTDKVLGIYKNRVPTLLETFSLSKWRKKESLTQESSQKLKFDPHTNMIIYNI